MIKLVAVENFKILDLAIDLELKTSECYEKLSRLASSKPLKDELLNLSREETVHANLLKTGRKYESSEAGSLGRSFIPIERVEDDLERIGRLIEAIDGGKIGFPDAIRGLYDLEIEFEQVHLASLFEIKDPALEKLFRALSTQDAGHRSRLEIILRTL
jgi:rubrerythrin